MVNPHSGKSKTKKSVGLLTVPATDNYGAFFQLFSLITFLDNKKVEASVIPFNSIRTSLHMAYTVFNPRKPLGIFKRAQKWWRSRSDRHSFIGPQAGFKLSWLLARARESAKLDYVVVGSDIVWDTRYRWAGGDWIYFGKGLEPKKGLIAYAASVGRGGPLRGDPKLSHLSKFNDISVRDATSGTVVSPTLGKNPPRVLDPCFLISPTQFPIRKLADRKLPSNFVVIYTFTMTKSWRSEIEVFAHSRNLGLVVTGYAQDFTRSVDRTNIGPIEWLTRLQESEAVVTGTFHGTIFALLYNKPFVVLGNSAIESKTLSLLRDFGLTDRYVTSNVPDHLLETPPHTESSRSLMAEWVSHSTHFLHEALGLRF